MLPRSFLSASSLTNDQKEIALAPKHTRTKRRRLSDGEAGIEDSAASDSSSESDSEESILYGNYSQLYLQNDISTLQNQIQSQQLKLKKHMQKVEFLTKDIRRNTRRLGRLTRLLISQQQQQQQHSESTQNRRRSSSTNSNLLAAKQSSKGRSTADDRDAPLFQTTPSKSIYPAISSSTIPSTTTTNLPPAETMQSKSIGRSRPDTPSNSIMSPSKTLDGGLAYKDTLDIVMRKKVTTMKCGFERKARMLLCNNNEKVTDPHLKDLMVSSSLDGELQFWNASDKKRIDKLGGGVIYKDTWIEDLCWASPTVLTLIPAPKEGTMNTQSVAVLDMKSVDRNSVKGDIQSMTNIPHEKGFDVITSADLGNHSSTLKERISFVTAGGDKTIYLWNLSRDSRDDSFSEEIHYLDIRHTNKIQALCMDEHSKILYSGGADSKFYAYDMQKGSSIYGFTLGSRINSINVNNANPNYALLGLSTNNYQFALYDKRCSSLSGIRLRFGAEENAKMSKYGQPDWHHNGHTVVYGSQGGPRLNFWDIRYTGVGKGPSFTIALDSDISDSKANKVLQSVFLPDQKTIATVTASRTLIWMDYGFSENCKPTPL